MAPLLYLKYLFFTVIISERVCGPRTDSVRFTAVGIITKLCPDGLVVCGWDAKLG